MLALAQLLQDGGHGAFRVPRVGGHVGHDHGDADPLVGRVPAVIVGRHAHERVGDLGFAEKGRFGVGGHVDDGAGEGRGAVEDGFGPRRELGSFCFFLGVSIGGSILLKAV